MLNNVKLVGKTTGKIIVNHKYVTKNNIEKIIYEGNVSYKSVTGAENRIKVLFENKCEYIDYFKKPMYINILGSFHSFNKDSELYKRRICELYIYPIDISVSNNRLYHNHIELTGNICADVRSKKSKNGRLIVESKIKVARDGIGRYDYIPIVAFDDNAKKFEQIVKDNLVTVTGRIHSRDYIDKDFNIRTAYEVNVHSIHQDKTEIINKMCTLKAMP